MDPFRLAVKSFIINESNKLLIVKKLAATTGHRPVACSLPSVARADRFFSASHTTRFHHSKSGGVRDIKRRDNDVHKPGVWEIPGGRLELGEDPYLGLQRETKEETGLDIEIIHPLDVHHFTRDDQQKITMIIFLCKALSSDVLLSKEHTHFEWSPVEKATEKLHPTLHPVISAYQNYLTRNE
ncbi:NUDIX domain-containing protein [Candidatus Woesearchaeota archaeon]|nr:NUDIX domain-containing protein [Candidatus Woesearchaeota archaeon]